MPRNKSSVASFFSDVHNFKWEMAFKSLLAGVSAGLLAVLYRIATEKGVNFAVNAYAYIKLHPVCLAIWIPAAVVAGLFIAWLIKKEPMASGGGVPQVEGVILYGLKMKWYTVIAVRYIAGILGSIFGLSFGPEGPSIQLGAAVNQGLSKKVCKTTIGENYLVTAGAAAGLSTAFSAPLTGMIFALEEIHRSFSPTILLSATTASLTADFISKYFFGLKPILYFANLSQLPLAMYGWMFFLGVFTGVVGVLINKGMLSLQTLYTKMPSMMRPVIALILCLPCGLLLPEVLGGGQELIKMTEQMQYSLVMLSILLLVKLLFSCTSFGSGTPGGIFMPIISIGALSGGIFGLIAVHFGMSTELLPIFVICSIAGGLSSCVKAPVTSIILTIEITGSIVHVLPVAICSFTALFISDLFRTTPIYEALLKRYIEKNGYATSADKCGDLMEFPVESGSEVSGSLLKDVAWPKESLIVGLRRGSEELIPKGDTKIIPGDYLLIRAPQDKENMIKHKVRSLCHKD